MYAIQNIIAFQLGIILLVMGIEINQVAFGSSEEIFKLDITPDKYVQIEGAADDTKRQLNRILNSTKLQIVILQVVELYRTDRVVLTIDDSLEEHGGFDPDSNIPKILLNPKTGISKSNLAHELIHAIQIKQGYPTVPKIVEDKRANVLRELCSNIMHISLTGLMVKSGFSIEEYLRPTLINIKNVLSTRATTAERHMIYLRAHYDASVYLRLHFEAKFLSYKERQEFDALFQSKARIAKSIGKSLIKIINKYDTHSPNGAIKALYACVEFLNNKDLSPYYSDYVHNAYSPYLQYWRQKYPFLNNHR